MNLKKMILPTAIALTAAGAGSLMTQPSKTETQQETTIHATEQNSDPLMSHDAAIALTAIGLGGLSYLGAKRLDGKNEKVKNTASDKDINSGQLDEKSKINIANVKKGLNNCDEYKFDDNLMRRYYLAISSSKTNNEDAKKEALAILKGLTKLYHSAYKEFLMEVPKLNYLLDKMASTNEEWETKKLCYPHYEEKIPTEHYQKIVEQLSKNYKTAQKALENGQTVTFQNECKKIKEQLCGISTGNTSEFANAMLILNSLINDEHLNLQDIYCSKTIKTSFNNLSSNLRYCTYTKDNPATADRKSKNPAEGVNSNATTNKTSKTNKTVKSDKDNISAGDNVKINDTVSDITFNDVGGQDDAIRELKKKIMFPLRYPEAFKGQKLNVGAIMYGRPGTGKSLLALALANESGANFIKVNASDMTASLHGATEKNWRDLFEKARKNQPCIIFIDEMDSVATQRGTNKSVNYDDITLNQILALMSDVEKRGDKIFVLGATNRFDMLDSAAKRSGRFGTHIEIKPPQSVKDVIQILDIHTKGKRLADDINKEDIAKMLLEKNVTGSDIAAIVNNASENAFIRLGIYEKMDNGTFTNDDIKNIIISYNDLARAIIDYNNISY